MKTKTLLAGVILLGISASVAAAHKNAAASATQACSIQGVWKLVRVETNGKPDSTSVSERKIMTKNHFMWATQENRRDTLPLKTYRDSVRYFNDGGGSGTYTVSGANLTEHIDIFPDPTWLGRDFKATCRTTTNAWYHTWLTDVYKDSTGRSRQDTTLEIYRREE